jgi:hypothetical protein
MDDGLKSKSDIKDEVGWTKRAPEIGLVCGPRFSGCLSVSALDSRAVECPDLVSSRSASGVA